MCFKKMQAKILINSGDRYWGLVKKILKSSKLTRRYDAITVGNNYKIQLF